MQKTFLTTAVVALIGLGSIATASAQFATGANEGMSNTTTMQKPATDSRMNAMNKMKKKKMMKKDSMSGDKMSGEKSMGSPSMPQGGGMEKKM